MGGQKEVQTNKCSTVSPGPNYKRVLGKALTKNTQGKPYKMGGRPDLESGLVRNQALAHVPKHVFLHVLHVAVSTLPCRNLAQTCLGRQARKESSRWLERTKLSSWKSEGTLQGMPNGIPYSHIGAQPSCWSTSALTHELSIAWPLSAFCFSAISSFIPKGRK